MNTTDKTIIVSQEDIAQAVKEWKEQSCTSTLKTFLKQKFPTATQEEMQNLLFEQDQLFH